MNKAQKLQNEIAHRNIARLGVVARQYRQRWTEQGRPAEMQKSINVARRYIRIFG